MALSLSLSLSPARTPSGSLSLSLYIYIHIMCVCYNHNDDNNKKNNNNIVYTYVEPLCCVAIWLGLHFFKTIKAHRSKLPSRGKSIHQVGEEGLLKTESELFAVLHLLHSSRPLGQTHTHTHTHTHLPSSARTVTQQARLLETHGPQDLEGTAQPFVHGHDGRLGLLGLGATRCSGPCATSKYAS